MLISCHSFSPLRAVVFFLLLFFFYFLFCRRYRLVLDDDADEEDQDFFFLAYRLVKRIHRLIDPSRPRRRLYVFLSPSLSVYGTCYSYSRSNFCRFVCLS